MRYVGRCECEWVGVKVGTGGVGGRTWLDEGWLTTGGLYRAYMTCTRSCGDLVALGNLHEGWLTLGDRTTLSVLGRMALVSCYTQVVPTTTTVSGVVHLRVNSDNGNMLVPLFAICATCLIHKCEDTIQAVELWGKGKVLY